MPIPGGGLPQDVPEEGPGPEELRDPEKARRLRVPPAGARGDDDRDGDAAEEQED
jgi:hypothetical protein